MFQKCNILKGRLFFNWRLFVSKRWHAYYVFFRCECSVGWKGPLCETPSHICPEERIGSNMDVLNHGTRGSATEQSTKLEFSCDQSSTCVREEDGTPSCVCSVGRKGDLCQFGKISCIYLRLFSHSSSRVKWLYDPVFMQFSNYLLEWILSFKKYHSIM